MSALAQLGKLRLSPGGAPRLAVILTDKTCAQSRTLKNLGVDIAEIRVDLFEHHTLECIRQTAAALGTSDLATILTIRQQVDGGHWPADLEHERLSLLREVASEVDAIDIEYQSLAQNERTDLHTWLANYLQRKSCIISFHDCQQTPQQSDLQAKVDFIWQRWPEHRQRIMIKMACYVTDPCRDLAILQQLLQANRDKNMIVIGMGELGSRSRVEFGRYGSLITYTCPTDETPPLGQLPLDQMKIALDRHYPTR